MKAVKSRVTAIVVVVLSLAASAGAASASASGFEADEYPAAVSAETTSLYENTFHAYGNEVYCAPMDFRSPFVSGPFDTVEWDSWIGGGNCGAGIAMKDCSFALNAANQTISIVPSGCGPIELREIYFHCNFLVQPDPEYTANAEYTDNEDGTVRVHAAMKNLDAVSSNCPIGKTETAEWHTSWLLSAENELNESTGLHLG